jgi:hypothetical protein
LAAVTVKQLVSMVLSATVNRLNIDLQECRQIITKKDSEISRLQVQYNESVRQLETLVSFARKYDNWLLLL